MRWPRKRTTPTVTELTRVERVLEADSAIGCRLGPKDIPVRKRSGEQVFFAAEAVAVAQELMVRRFNPKRAHVRVVLMVAAEVLGIVASASSGAGSAAD